ncbi:MAG TPA: protein kinase [Planctomycetota bacterium]
MMSCSFCARPYEGDFCPRCDEAVDIDKVLGVLQEPKEPTALPPREIGRFRVVRSLGEGGTGIVYEALDPVLGRSVALKILKPRGLSPELVERFLREARFLARLRHPNIVQIYELGRHADRDFLTMEYIEGTPFPGTADRREAVSRLAKVARALGHIHRRSIVHRDLKPSNILVDGGGRPVVMDFGIARSAEAVSTLSLAGSLCGTPAYMAPEQFAGETADARTDVYSLGVILYELLAGRRPFDGKTVVALAEQVRGGKAEPIPDVARELDAICRRAMSVRPEDRFPTADAMAEALEKLLSGRRRRRVPAHLTWALGGAIAGLLVVLTLFALRPSTSPPPPPPAPVIDTSAHVAEGRRLSLQGRFEEAHAAFDRAADRLDALVAKGEMVLTQQFALHADRLLIPNTVRGLRARLADTQGAAFDRLAARPEFKAAATLFAHVARAQWDAAKKAVVDDAQRSAIEFFADGHRFLQRKEAEAIQNERDVWRVYAAVHELRPVLAKFPNLPGPRRTSTHAGLLRLEALLHDARGEKEKALDALTRSLALAPDFLPSRLARALLLQQTKATEQAAAELQAARRQAELWGLSVSDLDSLR